MAIKLGKNFDSSKAVKSLVRGFKLVPHIDRFLPTWDEEGFTYKSQRKLPDDAWHPSGDCIPSLNALYHRAITHDSAIETKHAATSIKNFQVGHFWHQWLQWIVVEKLGFATWDDIERRGFRGWGQTQERVIPNTLLTVDWFPWQWVTGSADIASCEIPEHGKYLIDFKTMNSHHYRASEGSLIKDLAEKWECQVNIYMDFFDVERAIVVGINKDAGHAMQEFEFKRNQPLIDALYDKWEIVSGCVADGHEPPDDLHYPLPLKGTSR